MPTFIFCKTGEYLNLDLVQSARVVEDDFFDCYALFDVRGKRIGTASLDAWAEATAQAIPNTTDCQIVLPNTSIPLPALGWRVSSAGTIQAITPKGIEDDFGVLLPSGKIIDPCGSIYHNIYQWEQDIATEEEEDEKQIP